MQSTYHRKYVRFKWWQYRQGMAAVVLIIFFLGFFAGFFIGRGWTRAEKAQASFLQEQSAPNMELPSVDLLEPAGGSGGS
jgi:hypothetical protein